MQKKYLNKIFTTLFIGICLIQKQFIYNIAPNIASKMKKNSWLYIAQNLGSKYSTTFNNYQLDSIIPSSTTDKTGTQTANGKHTICNGFQFTNCRICEKNIRKLLCGVDNHGRGFHEFNCIKELCKLISLLVLLRKCCEV